MSTEGGCRRSLVFILLFSCITNFALGNTSSTSGDSTVVQMDSFAMQMAWFKPDIRSDLVNYAKDLLGIKYRYGGQDINGFDCSGFTQYIMAQFRIEISRSSRSQITDGEKVSYKDTKPGDLIFFRRSSKGRISHVAMVVSNDENGLFVIHSTSRGVVVDNLMESRYWRPKIYSAINVLEPFSETYAQDRLAQFRRDFVRLQELEIDVTMLAKSFRM